MNNKIRYSIFGILLMAVVFSLPLMVSSQGELIDSNVVIAPYFLVDNDNEFDGKGRFVISVISSPTNALSGLPDIPYVDKIVFDVNQPNKIDNKIVNSIKAKELALGRNVTNITWYDTKRIYP